MDIVAHRAGNTVAATLEALGKVDMIELDVHVLRGRVELRHEKVLHPTRRLWEKWYLLPRGVHGVPIEDVLDVVEPTTPIMIDLKCFTRRSARRIRSVIPADQPIVASTRSWWILDVFADRPNTRTLRSCGAAWQLWLALHRSHFDERQGVAVHERRVTPGVIAALHARTEIVYIWGATTAERCQELVETGVSGMILDDYSIARRC